MRKLALTNKKLRGAKRRLRALEFWANSWQNDFPNDDNLTDDYLATKIPVDMSLVDGKWTSRFLRSTCAQHMITAAQHLVEAKSGSTVFSRVTCIIGETWMFSSELCLFLNEDYFNLHTKNGTSYLGEITEVKDRSLAQEWSLILPKNFGELGVVRKDLTDEGDEYFSKMWYYGEVF